jgi:hypothetical protein
MTYLRNAFAICLLLSGSLFLSGCTEEELQEMYQEAKRIPSQIVVDTVGKLVTAESMFSSPDYEYTPESLEKLFLENEYFILVDDYAFSYCYDKKNRTFKDTKFDANFLVIGSSKLDNTLVMSGTAPFRAQWKELKGLSKDRRNLSQFEFLLEIQDGSCFEIELDEEYIQSLPQNKLLKKIPVEPSEWGKAWKEIKNFTSPIEDLFDSTHSEEKLELLPEREASISDGQLQKWISRQEFQK